METVTSNYRKKVGNVQTTVELSIRATNDEEIAKVLGVDGKAYVSSMEILNGEANYQVNGKFTLCYLNQDKQICTADEKVTVNGKFEDNTLSSTMEPLYKVEVVDVQILSANSMEVKVQATLEITLDVLDNFVIDAFAPTDDNVLVKSDTQFLTTKTDVGKAVFNVEDEFELKQPVNKVLLTSTNICVKQVTSGTGYFTVDGEVYVKAYLCYNDGENTMYKPFCETIPFKEEIDAENVNKDSVLETNIALKYDEVALQVNQENENYFLKATFPVCVKYVVLNKMECTLPCDCYSLTHKLNLVTDTYFVNAENSALANKHIEGNLEINENMARIGKILMISGFNLNITNAVCGENSVSVEGILTANVVYLADDEDETTNSVTVEIPFAINLDVDGVKEGDDLFVGGDVVDITAKAKKGKDIEIEAEISFRVNNYSKTAQTFVKEIVLTEELAQNPYPLEIYLAPAGASLWDIAKHLNVREDMIVAQNPDAVFPLDAPQSIVYFAHK